MSVTEPDNPIPGRSDHTIDDKNRLIVPQQFRDFLGAKFVMAMGPNHSIRAYPLDVYEQLMAFVKSRSLLEEFDNSASLLQRMIGNSELVTVDGQFRVTVPKYLKEWANLSTENPNAIFCTGSRVELWNRSHWADVAAAEYSDESVKTANRSRLSELSSAEPPSVGAA